MLSRVFLVAFSSIENPSDRLTNLKTDPLPDKIIRHLKCRNGEPKELIMYNKCFDFSTDFQKDVLIRYERYSVHGMGDHLRDQFPLVIVDMSYFHILM